MATVSETPVPDALATETPPEGWTVEDLAERFGPIPFGRIRGQPPPGTATEDDWSEVYDRKDRLCELVDGTLVEKTMSWYESYLAVTLIELLGPFVRQRRLGVVLAADGPVRFRPGLIRMPDVAFVPRNRLPKKRTTRLPRWLDVAPDLAVEVISRSNTRREMDQKLSEYFEAGVRLVWYVYPQTREVYVFTARDRWTVLTEEDTLDGGEVLPGFRASVKELFAEPLEEEEEK